MMGRLSAFNRYARQCVVRAGIIFTASTQERVCFTITEKGNGRPWSDEPKSKTRYFVGNGIDRSRFTESDFFGVRTLRSSAFEALAPDTLIRSVSFPPLVRPGKCTHYAQPVYQRSTRGSFDLCHLPCLGWELARHL